MVEGYNYRIDNPVYVYGAAVAVMLFGGHSFHQLADDQAHKY